MIECLRFFSFEKENLLGFADLFVEKWGVEIRGCTLNIKEGKRWVNLPSNEYITPLGETKYSSIISFRDKKHYTTFCQEAKKAIDKWIEENKKN
jgi:hypothetical protein